MKTCAVDRRRVARVALAVLVLAALLLVLADPADARRHRWRNRRPRRPPVVAVALKPPMQGLVDRQAPPPPEWSVVGGGPIDGYVLRVRWDDLQDANLAIKANNPIDVALAGLPSGLKLKVRILAGREAPWWLFQTAGSVILSDPGLETAPIVRWWVPEVKAAYDALISGLAARYDTNPSILDFTVSRCATFGAEPLLRGFEKGTNLQALWDAGLRAESDRQCQVEALSAHTAFIYTRSSLALNPYQEIRSATDWAPNEAFTESLMAQCRSILGSRCVLANNSLEPTSRGPLYDQMYQAIRSFGPPIAFQTVAAQDIANCPNLQTVLQLAIGYGANSVELPANYARICTPADLVGYDQTLQSMPFPTQ